MTIRFSALVLALMCWTGWAGNAWAGRAVQDRYQSLLLGRKIDFSVYLPNGYDKSTLKYPAIYLLHGIDGDQNEWLENGTLTDMNALTQEHRLRPMLAIMPSFGAQSWWIDGEQDKAESALMQELVPYVESKYRVLPGQRAVAGWTMGGYGALNLALKHPDAFCAAALISPEIHDPLPPATSGLRRMPQFMRDGAFHAATWQSLNYPARLPAYRANPARVPIWIVTGDDDQLLGLIPMVTKLYAELAAIQPKQVELRVIDGELDWATVRRALPDALRYIDRQCQSK